MKNKLILLIGLLVIAFISFLFFYFGSHNYTINYELGEVEVEESFDKEDKYYKFIFTYDDINFDVIAIEKYSNKRRLVNEVKVRKTDNSDDICLEFLSDYVNLYPICHNKDGYYSPYYSDLNDFKETDSFENIKISSLNDKTYLLWNYQNFIYLNNKTRDKISLFKKDIYNLGLVYQMDNYLLLPDYDEEHIFDKLYYINSDNAKVKDIELRYDVYFDSYFLGHEKEKVYLYDQKEEQEYYIDFKKDKIYKTGYKLLINNKWEKTTNQKLKNNKLSFTNKELFSYILEDNKLYGSVIDSDKKFLVTDKQVNKIVKQEGQDVYYIAKDILYYFNPLKGNKSLMKYSEWEFNNNNMIFIF